MTERPSNYNLKAVILETGLSSATLRAWERRYGLPEPQRSPGGHRLYSERDIEMLKWLVARQEEGLSIRHVVEMWRSLGRDGKDMLQHTHPPLPLHGAGGTMLDALRNSWIAACLVFDEQAAEMSLAQAFAIATHEIVCIEVLQKGLAEMGERWYRGTASVQQEHFASALAMRRIGTLSAAAAAPTRRGRILAACPPGEEHEFILLLLAYLLRRRGWDVIYLGANVPLTRLDSTLQRTSPRLIVSVAQTLNSAASLQEMADYVNAHGVALAYGGRIFNHIPALIGRISAHFLGDELAAAPEVVEHLLQQLPQLPEIQPVSTEYRELLEKFVEQEALIVASVKEDMKDVQVEPAHLEEANSNFGRNIASALMLGDIIFLDHSVG